MGILFLAPSFVVSGNWRKFRRKLRDHGKLHDCLLNSRRAEYMNCFMLFHTVGKLCAVCKTCTWLFHLSSLPFGTPFLDHLPDIHFHDITQNKNGPF